LSSDRNYSQRIHDHSVTCKGFYKQNIYNKRFVASKKKLFGQSSFKPGKDVICSYRLVLNAIYLCSFPFCPEIHYFIRIDFPFALRGIYYNWQDWFHNYSSIVYTYVLADIIRPIPVNLEKKKKPKQFSPNKNSFGNEI